MTTRNELDEAIEIMHIHIDSLIESLEDQSADLEASADDDGACLEEDGDCLEEDRAVIKACQLVLKIATQHRKEELQNALLAKAAEMISRDFKCSHD